MIGSSLEVLVSSSSQQLVERIGWVLIHSLWQFALLSILALAVSQWLTRHAASTRYLVLSAFLLAMVVVPPGTWFALESWSATDGTPIHASAVRANGKGATRKVTSPGVDSVGPFPSTNGDDPTNSFAKRGARVPRIDPGLATNIANEVATGPLNAWLFHIARSVQPWLPVGVAAWIVGVLLFSLRPILSGWTILRLQTVGVTAVGASIRDQLSKLQQTLRVRRTVRALQSSLIHSPVVVGVFRSVILLPVSLLANLPPAQLEAILAHELAHVKRYDYVINLLQTMVETLFF